MAYIQWPAGVTVVDDEPMFHHYTFPVGGGTPQRFAVQSGYYNETHDFNAAAEKCMFDGKVLYTFDLSN